MLYGSFRKSLDSLAALLWTPSIRTAMNKTEHGVRQVFGKLEVTLPDNVLKKTIIYTFIPFATE